MKLAKHSASPSSSTKRVTDACGVNDKDEIYLRGRGKKHCEIGNNRITLDGRLLDVLLKVEFHRYLVLYLAMIFIFIILITFLIKKLSTDIETLSSNHRMSLIRMH